LVSELTFNPSECKFTIIHTKTESPSQPTLSHSNSAAKSEKEKRKELEILAEIIETERNYTQDLLHIVDIFLVPMSLNNMVTDEKLQAIFSNIEAIQILHQSICDAFSSIDTQDAQQVAQCFTAQFANNQLSKYLVYCGNQNTARRCLNDLKNDTVRAKELMKLELNHRLKKLGLADLLVKPMHRITRYPLLFKRLLSVLGEGTEVYMVWSELISQIQETAKNVNDVVSLNESNYRIQLVDANMEFGSVCEVCFHYWCLI
jgi:hypothetical protein